LTQEIVAHRRPDSLRRIADRPIHAAETGNLVSIDGRPVQAIDGHDVLTEAQLTGAELHLIAAGGRREDEIKVIPPMPSKD
jgi:hypothetical protein